MYTKLTPEETADIEKQIDHCSLIERSKTMLKGLIAGQTFLRDLMENLVNSSGYKRQKIINELAKILEIDHKSQTNNSNQDKAEPADNPSNDTSKEREVVDEAAKNNDSSHNDGTQKELDLPENPQKKHPKRGNENFQSVISKLHVHEALKPGDKCPSCLSGKLYPFREKVIPILIGRSPLIFEQHRLQILRCNACGQLFEPKMPKEIPVSGFSTSAAQATMILLHYKIGVPFASISTLQKAYNCNVSPAQLWEAIELAAFAMEPIYNELKQKATNAELYYTDDTPARILSYYANNKKNREKKGKNKAPEDRVGMYSTLIIGCTPIKKEIYLFYHGRKYAGENLADILANRDKLLKIPIQMKDASSMNVPAEHPVSEAKCNAHAIRKFKDIRHLYPKWVQEILSRYGAVNKIEQNLTKKGATHEEKLAYHQEHSLPVMEEIKKYVKSLIDDKKVEPNSSLGEAISYFLNHYEGLIAFCKVEKAPFDNNKAERSLKFIIRLRKTSMFYKNEKGCKVASIMQSILCTAQEAGINVFDYLMAILENADKVKKNPADFLPWTFEQTINAKGCAYHQDQCLT